MRGRHAGYEETGFTLIELIIATAITGLMTATVAGMLSAVLVNKDATTVRMSQSHDAQSAASYFAQDVASIGVRDWVDNARPMKQSVEVGVAYNAGLYPCGDAGTPQALVRMAWNDFDPSDPLLPTRLAVVAYFVKAGPGGTSQLHRLLCQGATPPSDRVLVAALGSGLTAPTIACSTTCTSVSPPLSIALSLTVHDLQNKNPDYALTLTGHRRQT